MGIDQCSAIVASRAGTRLLSTELVVFVLWKRKRAELIRRLKIASGSKGTHVIIERNAHLVANEADPWRKIIQSNIRYKNQDAFDEQTSPVLLLGQTAESFLVQLPFDWWKRARDWKTSLLLSIGRSVHDLMRWVTASMPSARLNRTLPSMGRSDLCFPLIFKLCVKRRMDLEWNQSIDKTFVFPMASVGSHRCCQGYP